MYAGYWNFEREPFENTPDPDFFYFSPHHREALNWLLYGIRRRKGALVLTAGAGCGKTVISRRIIQELPREEYDVAVIVNPSLSPIELLREILYQLGVSKVPKSKVEILRELNGRLLTNHRSQRHTVIVVDEMQAVHNVNTLEELRLLLNFQLNDQYLLTLVLIGQPEWAERLADLPQLEQRIAVSFHLEPLPLEETHRYVDHRLGVAGTNGTSQMFTADSLRLIHQMTEGVPRRINAVCDRCLLVASQKGIRQIEEDLVRRIAS